MDQELDPPPAESKLQDDAEEEKQRAYWAHQRYLDRQDLKEDYKPQKGGTNPKR